MRTPGSTRALTLHPDRALPAEPAARAAARTILDATSPLAILSMHGHVEASMLAEDRPFTDPSSLLITPDHYLVRMLVSQSTSQHGTPGVAGVHSLGVTATSCDAAPAETDAREIWRRFASGWHLYRATPTRFWMEHVLSDVFEVTHHPSAENADAVYDHIAERLADPAYRPRALFQRFNIETLATTDPAHAALNHHADLAAEGWGERVVPTFRPDLVLHVGGQRWREHLDLLAAAADVDIADYASFDDALWKRRQAFIAAGARASDHGHVTADTTPLPAHEASRIFDAALRGTVTTEDAARFAAHMLFRMAEMSTIDGLTMQIHPGVVRDHSDSMARAYGHDIGYDIPRQTEYVTALRPMLDAFGHHPNFRVIVFTVDETSFSRELAPLAGVYPAMRVGAPWWFLDTPDGMRRFREAVTDTAGFYNTSGFVDDTRAFCSIPARHDLARRMDAGHLGRLVAEHRLDLDEAVDTAVELAHGLPRASYPRPRSLERTPA